MTGPDKVKTRPDRSGDAEVLKLSGNCTLREAEAIHRSLCAALDPKLPICVDCGEVAEADLTFLQLLLATGRVAAAERVALTVRAPRGGPLHRVIAEAGADIPALTGFITFD